MILNYHPKTIKGKTTLVLIAVNDGHKQEVIREVEIPISRTISDEDIYKLVNFAKGLMKL